MSQKLWLFKDAVGLTKQKKISFMNETKANDPAFSISILRGLSFLYKITEAKPTLTPSDSWATDKMRPTLIKILLENILYP